jgi:hypothetical protein
MQGSNSVIDDADKIINKIQSSKPIVSILRGNRFYEDDSVIEKTNTLVADRG